MSEIQSRDNSNTDRPDRVVDRSMSAPAYSGFNEHQQSGERATSPWQMIHDRLHGRWIAAVATALTLASIGGAAGWILAPMNYISRGVIEVRADLPELLDETAETARLPDLRGFIAGQIELIQSPRVVDRALAHEEVLRWSNGDPEGQRSRVHRYLAASSVRASPFIVVQFESTWPQEARDVVDAVIAEYLAIQQPGPKERLQARLGELRSKREDLRSQIDGLELDLIDMKTSSQYGTVDVDGIIASRVQEQLQLGARRNQLAQSGDRGAIEPTLSDLSALDPMLATLNAEIHRDTARLTGLLPRLGDEHPEIQSAEARLNGLKIEFEERSRAAYEEWELGPGKVLKGKSVDELVRDIDARVADLKAEIATLNREQMGYRQREKELARIEKDEAVYTDAIQKLESNQRIVEEGRVRAYLEPEVPREPSKDRKMQLAPMGAVTGFSVGIGLFFLLGTVDRRAFGVTQLERSTSSESPLIGLIPDMLSLRGDPEAGGIAAQCIHRLRNRIEMLRPAGSGFILCVSSPFQGDGKTSVATSLGWSYASAGHRTILVDCDFVGQALSHQFQHLGAPGLKEVIRDGVLNGEVVELETPNLSLLPIGIDPVMGPETVRFDRIQRLFGQLRRSFEIIVVDTGPLSASVESLPIAATSDGVVLSLRRGRPRGRLEECIADLRKVGANCLGVVLNCANRAECYGYSSQSRVSAEVDDGPDSRKRGRKNAESRYPLLTALGAVRKK